MAFTPSRLPTSASSASSVRLLVQEPASQTAARRIAAVGRHMSSSSKSEKSPLRQHQEGLAAAASAEAAVLTASRNATRTFVLNRPKKLNAIDTEMVDLLHAHVDNWSASRLAKILIGRGASGRAFCAGGDIKQIAELSSKPETRVEAMEFFKKEFELDWKLASYSVGDHAWDGSKMYIAFMEGVTMGGGAGLSFGGVIRIATEKTKFAMPETLIGYTPDVGATYYLNQLDGEIGTYLAVTGETIAGRSCFDLGIATHFVPSHLIEELQERLNGITDPDKNGGILHVLSLIEEFEQAPRIESPAERRRKGLPPVEYDAANPNSPTRFVGAVRSALDEAFSKPNIEAIMGSLESMVLEPAERVPEEEGELPTDAQRVSAWALETLEVMKQRSRISMEVSLLGMRHAARDAKKAANDAEAAEPNAALKRAFQREYRAVEHFVHNESPDFPSGVIDKLVKKVPAQFAAPDKSHAALAAAFYPSDDVPLRPATPALELLPPVHGFAKYPYRAFGLPSEGEVRDIVEGKHRTSGDFSVNRGMVFAQFDLKRPGVKDRLSEILERMTTMNANGWLSWRASRAQSWERRR